MYIRTIISETLIDKHINNDLKSGLINKGFNINIDDLEILTIGDRNIQLTKIVKNRNSDPIYMEIRLTINDWNGKKQYDWMDIDDFYIDLYENELKISGIFTDIENIYFVW